MRSENELEAFSEKFRILIVSVCLQNAVECGWERTPRLCSYRWSFIVDVFATGVVREHSQRQERKTTMVERRRRGLVVKRFFGWLG
jgi:hypothetical protein